MNTMTVSWCFSSIYLSNPAAQSVVSGVTGFTAANLQFDAHQSGEDVRLLSCKARVDKHIT